MALDIVCSRAARLRPPATPTMWDRSESHDPDEVAPAALPSLPDFGFRVNEIVDEAADTPMGRVERWQRKLLDLSLRNRLLNFRDTRQTLPLRCTDIGALVAALADGRTFRGLMKI